MCQGGPSGRGPSCSPPRPVSAQPCCPLVWELFCFLPQVSVPWEGRGHGGAGLPCRHRAGQGRAGPAARGEGKGGRHRPPVSPADADVTSRVEAAGHLLPATPFSAETQVPPNPRPVSKLRFVGHSISQQIPRACPVPVLGGNRLGCHLPAHQSPRRTHTHSHDGALGCHTVLPWDLGPVATVFEASRLSALGRTSPLPRQPPGQPVWSSCSLSPAPSWLLANALDRPGLS